jgi:tetratricopeptide (TPR) repeat protein
MEKLAERRPGSADGHQQIKSLIDRAYALRCAHYGDDHPAVAKSLHNLALFALGKGDSAEALDLATRALSIVAKAKAHDEIATAEIELTIARAMRDGGRNEEAREVCDRALVIYQKVGPNSVDLAQCLTVSARIADALGDVATARARFEQARDAFERILGPDHPATGTTLINIAGFRERDGDYAAAAALIERALEIHRAQLGDDHRLVAYTYARLAGVHETAGDTMRAIALLENAATINAVALPAGHVDAVSVRNRLDALRRRS